MGPYHIMLKAQGKRVLMCRQAPGERIEKDKDARERVLWPENGRQANLGEKGTQG